MPSLLMFVVRITIRLLSEILCRVFVCISSVFVNDFQRQQTYQISSPRSTSGFICIWGTRNIFDPVLGKPLGSLCPFYIRARCPLSNLIFPGKLEIVSCAFKGFAKSRCLISVLLTVGRYNPPKMKFDTKIWHPNISSQVAVPLSAQLAVPLLADQRGHG